MRLRGRSTKLTKLEAMADVFCTSCQYGDEICDILFCDPSRFIVTITMTIMRTFCTAMETTNTQCFRDLCSGFEESSESSDENSRDTKTVKPEENIVCVGAPNLWNVTGMDQWCNETCSHGYSGHCIKTLCTCTTWKRPTGEYPTDCTTFKPTIRYADIEGMSEWCQRSCSKDNCPSTHCQCAETVRTTKITTPSSIVSQTQYGDQDKDSLDVVSDLVCEQALLYKHNQLERRYCDKQETTVPYGYDQGLLGQVQTFAPQILCALTKGSSQSNTCSNMFCGDKPTASVIIRSAMCSVCEHFNDILESDCVNAYCR